MALHCFFLISKKQIELGKEIDENSFTDLNVSSWIRFCEANLSTSTIDVYEFHSKPTFPSP